MALGSLNSDRYRCVFGEMFKGKPILAGSSDLNQIQQIFNLVGTPTEETMPGWSSLPGCEGVKNFGYKLGNLSDTFKELVSCLACPFVLCLSIRLKVQIHLELLTSQ